MATMITDAPLEAILNNPFLAVFLGAIISIIIFAVIFTKKKKDLDYKRFVPTLFKETINDELKRKFDIQGKKFKGGKLYVGLDMTAHIIRYFHASGRFSHAIFDPKSKDIIVEDKDTDEKYNLLFIQASSKNIIFRLLGIKKTYFIINSNYETTDKKTVNIVQIDEERKRIFVPGSMDWRSYGGVWINSMSSFEYVNDISMKRMISTVMMHLENTPDKVAHMEQEQAKLERSARTYANIERDKWEERKSAGDTTIS